MTSQLALHNYKQQSLCYHKLSTSQYFVLLNMVSQLCNVTSRCSIPKRMPELSTVFYITHHSDTNILTRTLLSSYVSEFVKILQIEIVTEINFVNNNIITVYNVYIHTYRFSQNTTINEWYFDVFYITVQCTTTCFGLNRPSSGCRT
jgi:hypothetical protein